MTKVLMIATSCNDLGDTGNKTGIWLSELTHPYTEFSKNNFTIDIASPKGGEIPVDPNSLDSDNIDEYKHLLKNSKKLSQVSANDYDGIFYVGGHGAMYDLPDDADSLRLLKDMDKDKKIIAAVCHGQAALKNAKNVSGEFIVNNRKLTSFSNAEEDAVGLTGVVPFALETELRSRGAIYQCANVFQEQIVEDEHLLTGQNPPSAAGLAQTVSKKIASLTAA